MVDLDVLRREWWEMLARVKEEARFLNFRLRHEGSQRHCNLCGWRGSLFYPLEGIADIKCPKCRSRPRQRLLKVSLEDLSLPRSGARILHVSPKGEESLARWLKAHCATYVSIDKGGTWNDRKSGGAMLEMDLTDLQFPDGSFDFVCCNHVLENIIDVRQAIDEVYRVLAPGGSAALLVQIYGATTTRVEYPAGDDYWHAWHPGLDWFERYREAGFSVQIFDVNRPDKNLLGLNHNVIAPICQKPAP